jgi:ribokinase
MLLELAHMQKDIDFVAIGDIVTDVFIRLEQAHEVCNIATGKCELCVSFADKVPFEFAEEVPAVGNCANAAVSAARLGLTSALVANLGDDQHGKECLEALAKNNVMPDFVVSHPGAKTNYHYVLWYGKDRTILVKHEDYPQKMPDIGSPKWVYLTSLGEKSADYHKDIEAYLEAHPGINLAFQPGTFQINIGTEALAAIYKHTKIFFCNVQEAQKILKTEEKDLVTLMRKLRELGPQAVVVTDGPDGAYAFYDDTALFIPAYPDPRPAYERTGAGDAFASTLTVAIALGKTVEEALKWACINSANVVQYIGAQKGLLLKDVLEETLSKAPADWQVKKIN